MFKIFRCHSKYHWNGLTTKGPVQSDISQGMEPSTFRRLALIACTTRASDKVPITTSGQNRRRTEKCHRSVIR